MVPLLVFLINKINIDEQPLILSTQKPEVPSFISFCWTASQVQLALDLDLDKLHLNSVYTKALWSPLMTKIQLEQHYSVVIRPIKPQ